MDQDSTELRFGSAMILHSKNQTLAYAHVNPAAKSRRNFSDAPLNFPALDSDHGEKSESYTPETPAEVLVYFSKLAENFVGTKPSGLCSGSAPLITGIAINSEYSSPHGSSNGLFGAGSLDCDKFEAESVKEIRDSNSSIVVRSTAFYKKGVSCMGLDLLVDAIRVASGTSFEEEDVPFHITHDRKGAGNGHGGSGGIERRKNIFVHMGVPAPQRRVLRRAKNVYKSRHYIPAHIMLPAREAPVRVDSKVNRKRREFLQRPDIECGHQTGIKIGIKRNFKVVEVKSLNARTKSRRSLALPSKYYDSVLQPWKRGTRLKKEVQ